ncbi:hypothetical protein D9M72_653750 [compost metagenome]
MPEETGPVLSLEQQPRVPAGGDAGGAAKMPLSVSLTGVADLLDDGRVVPVVPAVRVPHQEDGCHAPILSGQ